jgi:formate hydrogenlyase subunit 6/NADH:ubiquinone oxidoreductase subunit I
MFKKAASNVFAQPSTTLYPYVKLELEDNFRGQPLLDTELCVGCGSCSRDCPSRAIDMVVVGAKKFPQFHLDKCVFCYQCAESCPKKAIKNSTNFELATTDKSTLTIKPKSMIIA